MSRQVLLQPTAVQHLTPSTGLVFGKVRISVGVDRLPKLALVAFWIEDPGELAIWLFVDATDDFNSLFLQGRDQRDQEPLALNRYNRPQLETGSFALCRLMRQGTDGGGVGAIENQAIITAFGELGAPTEDTPTDGNGREAGQWCVHPSTRRWGSASQATAVANRLRGCWWNAARAIVW